MKLLRHGPVGAEKPGALDADGQARDLSLLVPDFTPEWMAPAKLAALKAANVPPDALGAVALPLASISSAWAMRADSASRAVSQSMCQ